MPFIIFSLHRKFLKFLKFYHLPITMYPYPIQKKFSLKNFKI